MKRGGIHGVNVIGAKNSVVFDQDAVILILEWELILGGAFSHAGGLVVCFGGCLGVVWSCVVLLLGVFGGLGWL